MKYSALYNGNFLRLFELLAKRDPVLMEPKNQIIKHTTKKHYLSNTIQNELINIVAKKVEKKLMTQLTKAKYYGLSLDCTPDISHKEQMTVILRFVQCDKKNGVIVKEAFLGYLRVDDTTGRGLLDRFMERAEELGLNFADCRGQYYDNGANMKGKEAGVLAKLLEINSKALYVPCANHSWNLVIMDCAKSSTEALLFFGVFAQLYTVFSSSTSRWTIVQKHVKISIQSPSATCWESRIKCIVSLRFYLSDVLDALEELQSYCIQNQDWKTSNDVCSLINAVSSWKLILAIAIWHDILFQVNKTSKFMQTCGVSLDVIKSEIHTTQSFLQDYRQNGYNTAMLSAHEIAEEVGVESALVEKKKRSRNRMFDYESEDQSSELSQESQFKVNFFLHLVDHAIALLNNRFEQTHFVTEILNFLLSQENLLKTFIENNILDACKTFHDKLGNIDPFEIKEELGRFVHVINENKESLKTIRDFLDYI